ncbi:DEAD-box ATP-dependent RNA helicase 50 [Zostera marina]|uniref:DEAD-box ATP-dependent RNA helicase 50 n=1 Tax=Zostera marina TaxID=29655 RepID=A0A0K9PG65_ZOSMR|nr:DEAD-box ATP-dependent RNA helicase 50 [Zostera marina]
MELYTVRSGASSDGGINDDYNRILLETSDAYRLVNDQTGENFIVWGDSNVDGTKDFSQPLPTQNPNRNPPSPSERPSGVTKSRLEAVIGGFGKLKAQKIRALVKSSRKSSSSSSLSSSDNRYKKKKSKQNYHDDDVVDQTSNDSNFLHVIAKKSPPPSRTRLSDTPKVSTQNHPTRGWGSSASAPYVGVTDSVGFSKHQQLQPRQHKKINENEDDSFFSRRSFIESGSSDYMVHALLSLQFIRPSNIQAMSYSTFLQGKSCIVPDQSGSGKTLAYLCLIIQCLREQELIGTGKSSPKNPRVVVLVSTAELANQVLSNCRSISKYGVPFRSMVATGGFRQKTQLESLQQELDILIATSGRFLYLLKEGFVELSNLKSVVLDEVDILFGDEEFDAVLKSLINSASMATQYLFVTATLPVDIYNKLVEVFPDCDVLMGPGMHRISSGLEEVFVDCSGDGEDKNPDTAFLNKKGALLQLIEQSPVFKTIVFCNKIEICRKIENILKRVEKVHRIRALPFHSALEQ